MKQRTDIQRKLANSKPSDILEVSDEVLTDTLVKDMKVIETPLQQFINTMAEIGLQKANELKNNKVPMNGQEIDTINALQNLAATLYALR